MGVMATRTERVEACLRETAVDLDQEIVDFVVSIVEECLDDWSGAAGLHESVGELLIGYGIVEDEDGAIDACIAIADALLRENLIAPQHLPPPSNRNSAEALLTTEDPMASDERSSTVDQDTPAAEVELFAPKPLAAAMQVERFEVEPSYTPYSQASLTLSPPTPQEPECCTHMYQTHSHCTHSAAYTHTKHTRTAAPLCSQACPRASASASACYACKQAQKTQRNHNHTASSQYCSSL